VKWFVLMLIMLVTNGMSAFGLKVISSWGLPEVSKFPYLTVWYAAGFACIAVPMLLRRTKVGFKEFGWGAVMAILSIGGQLAMATALNLEVPGNIVFPVTSGGAVLAVGVAGWVFFGERMNPMTTVGTVLGFLAVILLSFS
jgi:multidrug transporter EmrE-like cation transporter